MIDRLDDILNRRGKLIINIVLIIIILVDIIIDTIDISNIMLDIIFIIY